MLSFWETALFSPRFFRFKYVAVNLGLRISPHPPYSNINSSKNLKDIALPFPLPLNIHLLEGPDKQRSRSKELLVPSTSLISSAGGPGYSSLIRTLGVSCGSGAAALSPRKPKALEQGEQGGDLFVWASFHLAFCSL